MIIDPNIHLASFSGVMKTVHFIKVYIINTPIKLYNIIFINKYLSKIGCLDNYHQRDFTLFHHYVAWGFEPPFLSFIGWPAESVLPLH